MYTHLFLNGTPIVCCWKGNWVWVSLERWKAKVSVYFVKAGNGNSILIEWITTYINMFWTDTHTEKTHSRYLFFSSTYFMCHKYFFDLSQFGKFILRMMCNSASTYVMYTMQNYTLYSLCVEYIYQPTEHK